MEERTSLPRIAVVMPVYNEQAVLPEAFERLRLLFDTDTRARWTAIMVDDGSSDQSANLISLHTERDPRFRLVCLSRNFGFQAALAAGLAEARDFDAVITMDADMQDPPEVIPQMVSAWLAGAGVVRAVRRSRQETGLRRFLMDTFHALFAKVSDFPVGQNAGTFGLLGREALQALNALPEKHRFFPGLRAWVGFKTFDITYDRQERAGGEPKQTFRRLFRYAFDGVFSFSYLPLRVMTYFGLATSLCGFVLGAGFVLRRLFGYEIAPTGFTTLVTLVLFLGGVQLIGIGVLGEYLARVYDEVKQRPLFIVRRAVPPAAGNSSPFQP